MARAVDVSFAITSARGGPVPDTVITAYPSGGSRGPLRADWAMSMDQRDLQFDPFVLIVPEGADVKFPNHDNVRHHVYSFSPAKTFELKLYGRDETRSVRFDKVGVVSLGCNIHDSMVAFIKVVDTPYAAKTDNAGQAILRGVPPGPAQVHIWHPYLKAADNELVQTVVVPASGTLQQAVRIDVRAAPDRRGSY
jgi:plastocyanin